MLRSIPGLIVLMFLIAGCATTTSQPNSGFEKNQITSVTLAEDVGYPPHMFYLGPGSTMAGAVFGVVGALLDAPRIERERQEFETVAVRGVLIDRIVFEEMRTALRAAKKIPLTDLPVPGGATMRATVTQYGFSTSNGFSSKLVPVLRVRLDLMDTSGRLVWTGNARSNTFRNSAEAVDAEVIAQSSAARESAWREAARALAKELLASY